jgi:hypothetical protein
LEHIKGSTQTASVLFVHIRQGCGDLSGKNGSLFGLIGSDEEKRFSNIDNRSPGNRTWRRRLRSLSTTARATSLRSGNSSTEIKSTFRLKIRTRRKKEATMRYRYVKTLSLSSILRQMWSLSLLWSIQVFDSASKSKLT